MVIEGTAEAEPVSASASDRRDYSRKVAFSDAAFHCILAVRCRAPLEIFLVIHVGTSQQYPISVLSVSQETCLLGTR